jgi:hypothetical protein
VQFGHRPTAFVMKPTNPTDVEDLEFINKLKSFIFYVIDNNVVQYINSSEL